MHRDLKTKNIFLDGKRRIKLGDFGLAKNLKSSIHKLKGFLGTPLYLAPEIVEDKEYCFKADIWSLGVILYEIMNLETPFLSYDFPELLRKISNSEIPPLNEFYSQELRDFVKQLMNRDVEQRPSINDLIECEFFKKQLFLHKDEFSVLVRNNKATNLKFCDQKLRNEF